MKPILIETINPMRNISNAIKRDATKRIVESQLSRMRIDINKWRNALQIAESKTAPDRAELMRIFQEVILDTHITSVIESTKQKVCSIPFKVLTEDAENIELTRVLEDDWFYNFIDNCIDAEYYGYALIELQNIDNEIISKLIKHEYIIPEYEGIKITMYDSSSLMYIEGFNNLVWIDTGTFGLLNKAAPLYIYKKIILAALTEFNELYGVPLRIGKTNIRDSEQRTEMQNMLRDMGTSLYAVIDNEDELEIINSMKVGQQGMFLNSIQYLDEQFSKLFAGQTMVFDDGSSRSQSEVHERLFDNYIYSKLRTIKSIVNKKLFPVLRNIGIPIPENAVFAYDYEERFTLKEQADFDLRLMQYHNVDIDYLMQKYGTVINESERIFEDDKDLNNIVNKMKELYK